MPGWVVVISAKAPNGDEISFIKAVRAETEEDANAKAMEYAKEAYTRDFGRLPVEVTTRKLQRFH